MKNTIKTHLYKAIVNTPFGIFLVVVEETCEKDARYTIGSLVAMEFRVQFGNFRISEITKTTRKIIKNMHEANKGCSYDENSNKHQWGWFGNRVKD